MSNFVTEFKRGQLGYNKGLCMGIEELEKSINGIQRRSIYIIGAESKVGKTTFVDKCFLLEPYLYSLDHPEINIEWLYYSLEIDMIQKQFNFAAFFFKRDYDVDTFIHDGDLYNISANYLLGTLLDSKNEVIKIKPEHKTMLSEIYKKRLIPLFGHFDTNGKQLSKGKIKFISESANPTGISMELNRYAEENGEFIYESFDIINELNQKETRQRKTAYKPNDPNKFTIIITDHVRLIKAEKELRDNKSIMDRFSSDQVKYRNLCGFTFVDLVHLNRSISSIDRLSFMKDKIYPTADDIKDTGNLGENADVVITLFYPQDLKYNLKTYFNYILQDYTQFRSIHVVLSRKTSAPHHFFTEMKANIIDFNILPPAQGLNI